jgi:hypothetical protein
LKVGNFFSGRRFTSTESPKSRRGGLKKTPEALANPLKKSYVCAEDQCPLLERRSTMLAPALVPGRGRDKKIMEFFSSLQDKSLLLVMDSASRSGQIFKVAAEETWTLIWSGIVTQDFLESPAWKWEGTIRDPATFPGGWPKQKN